MIVIDTSALMPIVLDEPTAPACIATIEMHDELLVSAGTMAECLIVATRRNVLAEMTQIFDGVGFDVVAVTPAMALHVAAAYGRWGKGIHVAGLNFGDCFAYELAVQRSCPLLYVGDDFAGTDVLSAISMASP